MWVWLWWLLDGDSATLGNCGEVSLQPHYEATVRTLPTYEATVQLLPHYNATVQAKECEC